MTLRRLACTALLLGALAGPAGAVTDAEVAAAVDKGVTWLFSQQKSDGSFQGHWASEGYTSGETALALLTLLKAGADPADPRIDAGFTWLLKQPLRRTYDVSVAVLAVEARYTPPPKVSVASDDPLASQIRGRFQRAAPPRDRRWVGEAVAFLLAHQAESGLWKYPFYGEPDLSNAQFAALALAAAQRMGARVPKDPFLKLAAWLLEEQEESGPRVPSFAVPAADQAVIGLHDRRERERLEKERRRLTGDAGTRERAEVPGEGTQLPMQARGWAYKEGDAPRGSMTAAGLACLVICKSELEAAKGYAERLGARVDQALRDGAAWVAHRFRVDRNPGAEPDWLFYYLYTLERAGTLLAVDRFGGRDWYEEGAAFILSQQQGDGRIVCDTGGQSDSELAGTCLALLFLERSTVPVIKRERVLTGDDQANGGAGGAGPAVAAGAEGQAQVTFRYRGGPGQEVSVAGSFNGWDPAATRLADPDGDGVYEVTLTLGSGRHAYKFVLGGSRWIPDPENPESEPDGHGGSNSVVQVR